MIRLENIHVTFGQGTPLETRAVRGIDLTINKGEFVTVIGSNGSGKSTLLNTLSGETIPTRGKVIIGDITVLRIRITACIFIIIKVIYKLVTISTGKHRYKKVLISITI